MKEHQLVSIIPEYRERKITYDTGGFPPPVEGEYLVSYKKGTLEPSSVYQVCSQRLVKSLRYDHRYALKVIRVIGLVAGDVKPDLNYSVTVKGEKAHPLFWNKRNKK